MSGDVDFPLEIHALFPISGSSVARTLHHRITTRDLDVETPRTCEALLAAVQAVPVGVPIGAVPAAASGVSASTGALIATGVGIGAYLLYRNNRNVSPN